MTEPTIICPNCKTEIRLTESLAAPLIELTRANTKKGWFKRRRTITKQWAKREEQIDRVMQATVRMYGDLQGIAGKLLQEIAGLELKALDVPNKYSKDV